MAKSIANYSLEMPNSARGNIPKGQNRVSLNYLLYIQAKSILRSLELFKGFGDFRLGQFLWHDR
jgi:hypothetical protein